VSRGDTMLEERWRVQVRRGDRATHGSSFKDEVSARGYFESLAIAGSEKILERRAAGAARYEAVLRQEMR